jgi:predicted nuclease of restriction endonuclease-like RecB superfamily
MTDISKLTKKQLLDIVEQQEENRWDDFKEEFGVSFDTADEWIDFFKSIVKTKQDLEKEVKDIQYHLDNYNRLHTRG